ncbi:MAG: DNA methyltransferase [Acidobacteriota bacterium]
MSREAPELTIHKEWLGQIQQVGLVVSPHVLVKQNVGIDRQKALDVQTRLRALGPEEADEPRVKAFLDLATQVLEWPADLIAGAPGGPALPDSLTVALPEYDDRLAPDYALLAPVAAEVSEASAQYLALISNASVGVDLDKPHPEQRDGWRASPHARLERLLRESGVSIGLLFNHTHLRLVYAPRGESSGHLTFRFQHLLETQGRPMAGALYALLGGRRVTDALPDAERLPALLHESRKYQNVVSTKLAEQVLEALWELLRGFQRANDETKGQLLAEVLRESPQEVYGGLLSTLMRLVFILYAEDRGLMPGSDVYQKHYAVSGLFERLREDAARYPDTMDARFGAWAQLLALFRLIHDGGGHGDLRFPPRHGRLFDPDAYPFLEGRPHGSTRVQGALVDPPRVPDGTVFRVLQNLLVLDGERLSYRALDVEQIGSVYEAMMGFALQQAAGPAIAVRPKHIVVNLAELLEQKPKDRAAWLAKTAELPSTELRAGKTGDALARAVTTDELLAAIGKKVSREYTPAPLPPGAMFLQPTEERRRSGSHYTPRSLTQPIVATTFRPIFERLGERATPDQILDLKVCDPAMGSGAFLVEACRLLAERLVRAWEVHQATPKVPDDEDVLTYARRLVAERCLYGVDRNVFAVDLAKLSLWLATLAKEHPFTFLDHALRHGDSLVGLSREQIACFNWEADKQLPLLRSLLNERVERAQRLREQIQGMGDSDDVPEKARLLREANEALDDVRRVADLAVAAFFAHEKPRDRKTARVAGLAQVERWLVHPERPIDIGPNPSDRETFHWEIEFPEVFTRENPGFDAFVGNPPFAGKNTITASNGANYLQWLLELHEDSHGNADLVAHFYRRAFNLLRQGGAFGLIATNTIAQGDTRGTGLRWIRHHDGTIFAARKRIKWPGQAAVVVSVVHVHRGALQGPFDLDGRSVDLITAFLFHSGSDDDPKPLPENAGKSFIGSYVLGMGFTFDDTDKSGVANPLSLMHELIRKDPRNAERIFPYIGGEEVNDSPTHAHHRYVINFGQMSEEEARRWPDLMAIVEAKVKPKRLTDNRESYRRYWWQFAEKRLDMTEAIRGLDRVLVNSQVSKFYGFAFLPASMVFGHTLYVYADTRFQFAAVLQSRVHEGWAQFMASSLEERGRYTASTCFETFPFPPNWEANQILEMAGHDYYEFRAGLMVQIGEGLTKTYNRFHDPEERDADIERLRELHAAMDRAVLDAYGWTDIQPTCEFILDYEDDEDEESGKVSKRKKPWRYRWPDDVRDEVLGRLLALNRARAGAAPQRSVPARQDRQGTGSAKPLDVLISADTEN